MFCPYCGAPISDNSTFCSNCGNSLADVNGSANEASAPTMVESAPKVARPAAEPTPGPTAPPTPAAAPSTPPTPTPTPAAASVSTPTATTPVEKRKQVVTEAEQSGLGMKWYKFLIYFSLIAAAVISGIRALTSALAFVALVSSPSTARALQGAYAPVVVIYILATIVYAGMAVLYIVTRIKMSHLSKIAPTLVYACYAVSGVAGVIYSIAIPVAMGTFEASDAITAIFSIGVTALMIVLNRIYFQKRAHLFVNE